MERYRERAARCVDQIGTVAIDLASLGVETILEIGLIQRRERERFYRRLDAAGIDLAVYVVDAPRELRRERVEARNRARGATFSMDVPPAVFELASDLWEPPDAAEIARRAVRFVDTSRGPDGADDR